MVSGCRLMPCRSRFCWSVLRFARSSGPLAERGHGRRAHLLLRRRAHRRWSEETAAPGPRPKPRRRVMIEAVHPGHPKAPSGSEAEAPRSAPAPRADLLRYGTDRRQDDWTPLDDLVALHTADDAGELHRRLLCFPDGGGNKADAFEPWCLFHKFHTDDPEGAVVTALLLLTDRRWRNATGRLVRRIEESGLVPDDQLDLLAQTFLAAEAQVYWEAPGDWFDGPAIVLDADDPDAVDVIEDEEPCDPDDGPVVFAREIRPPLRRWAAGRAVRSDPPAGARSCSGRARSIHAVVRRSSTASSTGSTCSLPRRATPCSTSPRTGLTASSAKQRRRSGTRPSRLQPRLPGRPPCTEHLRRPRRRSRRCSDLPGTPARIMGAVARRWHGSRTSKASSSRRWRRRSSSWFASGCGVKASSNLTGASVPRARVGRPLRISRPRVSSKIG